MSTDHDHPDPAAPRYIGIITKEEALTKAFLILAIRSIAFPVRLIIRMARGGAIGAIRRRAESHYGVKLDMVQFHENRGKSTMYRARGLDGTDYLVTINDADSYFAVKRADPANN